MLVFISISSPTSRNAKRGSRLRGKSLRSNCGVSYHSHGTHRTLLHSIKRCVYLEADTSKTHTLKHYRFCHYFVIAGAGSNFVLLLVSSTTVITFTKSIVYSHREV